MTMLEKMARAMAAEDEKTHRRLNMYGVHKERYDAYARAALMAVREPNQNMMLAVQNSTGYVQAEDFTAMIDAILNEPT